MDGILLVFALLAAIAAVIFFAQSRSAGTSLLALREEQAADRKATEGDRTALREAQAELKQRSQQMLELREKLNDQKKRSEGKAQKAQPRGVREAELEEDLTHARALAEQAHASEQEARKQATAAKAQLAVKDAELLRSQEKVRELASRPIAAAADGAPSDNLANAALVSAQSDARRSEEKARETIARLGDVEAQLGASREREQKMRDEQRKARGRAETNNRAYLIAKGELEMMKERLAQAERRLWQAGIALPKPVAPERPKATGPASADRAREEAAPAASAAPEAEAAAEIASAPVDSDDAPAALAAADLANEPASGVVVRRRPTQAEAPKL